MISIIHNNNNLKGKLWAVVFWLAVWHLASIWIGQEILLVSPFVVAKKLAQLLFETEFWRSAAFSITRIGIGFLLGTLAGTLTAVLAHRFPRVQQLMAPPVFLMKSVPVASFIILVLIWVPSRNLSVIISFIMVFPLIYTHVLDGILQIDPGLLEMARAFSLPAPVRFRWVSLPEVMPYFRTGCSLALGLCWKAGVAAEVIGIPDHSIGEHLYQSKIYLETADLFAWTAAIVIFCFCLEKLFLWLLDLFTKKLQNMG